MIYILRYICPIVLRRMLMYIVDLSVYFKSIKNTRVAIRRFHSLFTPFGACDLCVSLTLKKERRRKVKSRITCWKGAFHLSLTVLVCYRSPSHVWETNHKYLAFDVSLPPELLSLKSQSDRLGDKKYDMYQSYIFVLLLFANVAVTLYSGDKSRSRIPARKTRKTLTAK